MHIVICFFLYKDAAWIKFSMCIWIGSADSAVRYNLIYVPDDGADSPHDLKEVSFTDVASTQGGHKEMSSILADQ